MNVQMKRDFKSNFLSPKKVIKSRQALHEIFFNLQYLCAEVLYLLFQNRYPHFVSFFLEIIFWKLSQLSGQDQQNGKQTYCRLPSLSQWTSRIHPLIFLWTPKGFISPETFLNFFLNLYIPPWLRKSFKFMVKITGKYICESKKWICSFLLAPPSKPLPQVLIITPRLRETTYSSRTVFSENLFFPQQRVGVSGGGEERIMELKKLPKLNIRGYCSQVLINSTVFANFTVLVFVLCHNLASVMLKCEGPLT